MLRLIGAVFGIGVGYLVAMGVAAFVSAKDVQSASLTLALVGCGLFGIVGLLAGPILQRR